MTPKALQKIRDVVLSDDGRLVFSWIRSHRHNGEIDPKGWMSGRFTTVADVVEAVELDKTAVVKLFKELEKAKVGQFLVGRHGRLSRFEWSYWPLTITGLINNQNSQPALISDDDDEEVTSDGEIAEAAHQHQADASRRSMRTATTRQPRSFRFDDGEVQAYLQYPPDLTATAAEDLARQLDAWARRLRRIDGTS